MMKKFTLLTILAVALIISVFPASAQISGSVFRDYNNNGQKDNSASFNEPLVTGITVSVYNTANTLVVSTTTAGNTTPNYSFSAAQVPFPGKYRVEFSGFAGNDQPTFKGIGNSTNVQFVGAASTTVNFSINLPRDYVSSTNPKVVVPNHTNGSGIGGTSPGIFRFDYTFSGSATAPTDDFTNGDLGTLWGTAYQKRTKRLFAAAMLRRHAGLGPRDMDGIYIMNYSTGTPSIEGGFDLQDVIPSNGGATIDLGTVTRTNITGSISAGAVGNYQLSSSTSKRTRDLDAFGKVGRTGIGDIDFSEDDSTLWIVNLNQRALIKVNTGSLTMNLANPNLLPTASVEQYPFLEMAGAPADDALGLWRPWGLGFRNGKGYIGLVNDASLSSTKYPAAGAGFFARIYSFNPANPTALTLEASFDLAADVDREPGYSTGVATEHSSGRWQRWMNAWNTADINDPTGYFSTAPQPIISDISFTGDGKMMIGMMDRWGYQGGEDQYVAVSGSTGRKRNMNAGDILYATQAGGVWTVEPSNTDPGAANDNTTGLFGSATDGPNGAGEFFYADNQITSANNAEGHYETAIGSVCVLPGTNEVLSTVYGATAFYTQGVRYFNETDGSESRSYLVKVGTYGSPEDFGKTSALGDIELLLEIQPIQVGNRIWLDSDNDGIQDADETLAGVPTGTTVTLHSPGIDGVYGNGDDQTWTTTTNANGNFYFATLSTPDDRKPADWVGVGNTVLQGYDYRIEVVMPASATLAPKNAGSNVAIDNDASLVGAQAIINFNTNNTTHNLDIGLSLLIVLPKQKLEASVALSNTTSTIQWVAENQVNAERFYIERSIDNRNYTAIGNLKAKGKEMAISHYSYKDDVIALSGLVYYRIKLIDNSGKVSYSNIVVVHVDNVKEVKVFPNPVIKTMSVALYSNKVEPIVVKVVDNTGKILCKYYYNVTKGANQLMINNLGELSEGLYRLQVTNVSGSISYSTSFIKM